MADPPFVWPLSGAQTPDEMNTSFGPRIDNHRWDFHDGIDLPAAVGTPVLAMADGVVHRAGPADKTGPRKGFGSTHVILKLVDPADGDDLYLVYLHLDRIAKGVVAGKPVTQGDILGVVGQEDAMYPHLHFEFRKGSTSQDNSRHPLHYLPYLNTANFSTPKLDRCNFSCTGAAGTRAIRVRFDVSNRTEGDVQRIAIKLKRANGTYDERLVDFDDRDTIESAKGEGEAFKNGVAVEGYQKSNMKSDQRNKPFYGVLVKNIGPAFIAAQVRVVDTREEHSATAEFSLPTLDNNATPVDSNVSFEDPSFPPAGWTVRVKPGNVCQRGVINSGHVLLCQDFEGSQDGLIRAGLRFTLPINRSPVPPMSWRLGANVSAAQVPMDTGTAIYPLAFLAGNDLVAAACLRRIHTGKLIAGVVIRGEDGMLRERISVDRGQVSATGEQPWELELLRIGTRETTAVLWLNGKRIAQVNGHTTFVEPDRACAGILHQEKAMPVTLHFDELFVTEALK